MLNILSVFLKTNVRRCSGDTMKYLNVAEKHDAAKTIAGFLSNGRAARRDGLSVYNKIFEFDNNVRGRPCKMIMTSVSGHMLKFAFYQSYKSWRNCDPIQLLDAPIHKITIEQSEHVRRTLEREIKSCQGLILWTDCDREGENIGFEIIEVCRAIKPNLTVYRAKFSEITAAAVRRALENLTAPDQKQNEAVEVRQELDLRTGAALTRLQTLRLQRVFQHEFYDKLVSYGSCQIPTLGFVAKRYKEVEAFVSEPFWKIKVTHTIDDLTVEFHWARQRLFNKEDCEDYLLLCHTEPTATVENVTVKKKNKWRPNPLDTVSLEKLGSRKLKIDAKSVMTIAEKLYTQGIISYPRTETNCFSKEIDLRSLVQNHADSNRWGAFANRVLDWGPNPRNGNKSDQAHPPIHPIKLVTNLSGNDLRVYELIVRHFLACVSRDAVGSETVVNISIAGEKFSANGLVIHERNYLDVYPYENWNSKQIHSYETGQTFEPTEISMQEGATCAPPLLTEADLIALMEKHGIGTDATHADHIHTIKERGYIGEVENGLLVPGVIGMGLYEGYDDMQLPLAEPFLRAAFEADLKKICDGEKRPAEVLTEHMNNYKDAYRKFLTKITSLDQKMGSRLGLNIIENIESTAALTDNVIQDVLKCPKCENCSMALKTKRDGNTFFISCLGYPDCRHAIWLPEEIKSAEVTSNQCSRCGPGFLKIKFQFKKNITYAYLNAEPGSYTTCIVCDSKFREHFNINVELVKRAGPVVAIANNNAPNTSHGNRGIGSRMGNNRNPQNSLSDENIQPASSRYRGWGNSDVQSAGNRTNRRNRVAEEEDPFEGDESIFAAAIVSSNVEAGVPNNREWGNPIELENRPSNINSSWGTSNSSSTINGTVNSTRHTNNRRDNVRPTPVSNGSSNQTSNWRPSNPNGGHQPNSSNQNSSEIKCSVCGQPTKLLTVRKEGPNTGRQFYACPKSDNSCKFFQWCDESQAGASSISEPSRSPQTNSPSDGTVRCSGCNQVAASRIVRKEGPNKGRAFYTCPNVSNQCQFFKWSDENSAAEPASSTNWGTGGYNSDRDQPSTSRGSGSAAVRGNSNQNANAKKRKCGLCRMEGHTKTTCPRKDEFDYN